MTRETESIIYDIYNKEETSHNILNKNNTLNKKKLSSY